MVNVAEGSPFQDFSQMPSFYCVENSSDGIIYARKRGMEKILKSGEHVAFVLFDLSQIATHKEWVNRYVFDDENVWRNHIWVCRGKEKKSPKDVRKRCNSPHVLSGPICGVATRKIKSKINITTITGSDNNDIIQHCVNTLCQDWINSAPTRIVIL